MAIETRRGKEVSSKGHILIPVARSLRLRLPGNAGGLVWNRPVGVVVEGSSGSRFLRVADLTRRLQWGILSTGLVIALLIRFCGRRRRGCHE